MSIKSNDAILRDDIMTLYLCTESGHCFIKRINLSLELSRGNEEELSLKTTCVINFNMFSQLQDFVVENQTLQCMRISICLYCYKFSFRHYLLYVVICALMEANMFTAIGIIWYIIQNDIISSHPYIMSKLNLVYN